MIKSATINDINILVEMAVMLWDSHDKTELSKEFEELINSGDNKIFIKFINDIAIGFAHCSLRKDYVEGTNSSPVGYLEGIYKGIVFLPSYVGIIFTYFLSISFNPSNTISLNLILVYLSLAAESCLDV